MSIVKFFNIFTIYVLVLLAELVLVCKPPGETCGAFYPTPCCNRCIISGLTAWETGTCN